MASLDVIKFGVAWKVRNGRSVQISIDPWPGFSSAIFCHRLYWRFWNKITICS